MTEALLMRGEAVRILLIGDLTSSGEEIRSLLSRADPVRAQLESLDAGNLDLARTPGGAVREGASPQLDLSGFDAIVFDGAGSGDRLLDRVRRVRRDAPATPLIVLADDVTVGGPVLSFGAQDCLVRHDLDLAVLMRAVRHAIQRRSVEHGVGAGDHEVRTLERMARAARSVASTTYGVGSLDETDVYPDLTDRYRCAVEAALDEQVYEGTERRSQHLSRELGGYLGVLRAHPRDVVRLHLDVVRAMTGRAGGRPSAAYLNVGRLVLIEVLGHLAAYYRNYAWGPPSAPDGAEAGTALGTDPVNVRDVHEDADGEGRA